MPPLARPVQTDSSDNGSDENEEEGLPTQVTGFPVHEPLVLWRNPDNPERFVEVSSQESHIILKEG